jgi:DNA modification methylase
MTMKILLGDCRETLKGLAAGSVNCCVTSPPYFGLRDYGHEGQIGLEKTPDEYVAEMVAVFREVRRVLRDDGTLWLNLGDSYGGGAKADKPRPGCGRADGKVDDRGQRNRNGVGAIAGIKAKDLIGIPWRVAFALQGDGWYLRQDIIWHKPNPMPESVTDRCTKSHEYIFLFSKSPRYHFDSEAIKEESVGGSKGASATFKRASSKRGTEGVCPSSPMATHRSDREDVRYDGPLRNRRDVWTVATRPYSGTHFATFPEELIAPCILAGCPVGGIVLDPFNGAGTTGLAAMKRGRDYLGCELNADYVRITLERFDKAGLLQDSI